MEIHLEHISSGPTSLNLRLANKTRLVVKLFVYVPLQISI